MSTYLTHYEAKTNPTQINLFFDRFATQIDEMEGRRGVVALREKLQSLEATHNQHESNLHTQDLSDPRDPSWPDLAREIISKTRVIRGSYDELITAGYKHIVSSIPDNLKHHPSLRSLAILFDMLHDAIETGVLPTEYQDWDAKGRGDGCSVDLYGFVPGLILVQVRKVERAHKKWHLNVKKSYLVSDGVKSVEVSKAIIRRACAVDQSPDSALRAVRKSLPDEWKTLVPDVPVKLPAPVASISTVYKVLARYDDGTFHSLFAPEFTYTIGKWITQKARPDHNGGIYAWSSEDDATDIASWEIAQQAEGTLVLCKCTAKGTPVEYENGKKSFSLLRVDEVLCEVEHA